MDMCPCGSERDYSTCCGPYHAGTTHAPTAVALMRSRYSAYVLGHIDYLLETHDPAKRANVDRDATRAWAEESEWLGLEIRQVEAGGVDDTTGVVGFEARYRAEGEERTHAEVSTFVRRKGRWYFSRSASPTASVEREAPKVGRNDPCPCGSGKKYKKCCGA